MCLGVRVTKDKGISQASSRQGQELGFGESLPGAVGSCVSGYHAAFRLAPISGLWALPPLVLSWSITAIHREVGRETFLETPHQHLNFLKRWAKCQSRNGNLLNLWNTMKFHLLRSKEWMALFFSRNSSQKPLRQVWSAGSHWRHLYFCFGRESAAVTSLCLKEWDFSGVVSTVLGHFTPGKSFFFLTPEAVGDRDVHKRISKIREAGCECHCTLLRVCQGWAGIK